MAAHQRDAALLDPRQLRAVVEVVHHLVAAAQHGVHVQRAGRGLRGARDTARLGQRLGGAQQGLGGHARVERALPADQLALDQRHAQAVFGRASGTDLTRRAGAHHHHVELVLAHLEASLAGL